MIWFITKSECTWTNIYFNADWIYFKLLSRYNNLNNCQEGYTLIYNPRADNSCINFVFVIFFFQHLMQYSLSCIIPIKTYWLILTYDL